MEGSKYLRDTFLKKFDEIVKRYPNKTAIVSDSCTITYKELEKRSNELSKFISAQLSGKERAVGIYIDRTIDAVVSILAVIKSRGYYVPLNPSYPIKRTEFMIHDAGIKLVLANLSTETEIANRLNHAIKILNVNNSEELNEYSLHSTNEMKINKEDAVYAIYTSGTTGNPKGVIIEHGALNNQIEWLINKFKFDENDIFLQRTNFSFDASVWEIFTPLSLGGTMVIAPKDSELDPWCLIRFIKKHNITVMQLVPSLLEMFLDIDDFKDCKSIKYVFCGGEVLQFDIQKRFLSQFDAQLINLYGPTENCINSTFHICNIKDDQCAKHSIIGKPIFNVELYILNKSGKPVLKDEIGEIFLGGAGLARGYINNNSLTQAYFKEVNINGEYKRLYKTGDFGSYLPNGDVQYLGRKDAQVKIRGFRIELGEIEMALKELPRVEKVKVLVLEEKKKVVAFVVSSEKESTLKTRLEEKIPLYMIPHRIVNVKDIPLNMNGKVDKNQLMSIYNSKIINGYKKEMENSKSNNDEIKLLNIWKEVIGNEHITVQTNFFECGGDSIIAIQIVNLANRQGIMISPIDVLKYQNIKDVIKNKESNDDLIKVKQGKEDIEGEFPLTPIQNRFFNENVVDKNHWNMSLLCDLSQEVKLSDLNLAFNELLKHHDSLRTTFLFQDNNWRQCIKEYTYQNCIEFIDLSHFDEKKINKIMNQVQSSLDIKEGPLIKGIYIKMSEIEYKLLIVIHHIIIDGISQRIIIEDLNDIYSSIRNGQSIKLLPKTTSLKSWVKKTIDYLDSSNILPAKKYWLNFIRENQYELLGIEEEKDVEENGIYLKKELTEEDTHILLKTVPEKLKARINEILLAPLYIAHKVMYDKNSLLLEIEGHGREYIFDDINLSRTVGWFTSIFPIKIESNSSEIPNIVKEIGEYLSYIPNKGIDYGILKYLGNDDRLKNISKPNMKFNYLGKFSNDSKNIITINKNNLKSDISIRNKRTHSINITCSVINEKMNIVFDYNSKIYHQDEIEKFMNLYIKFLRKTIQISQDKTKKHFYSQANITQKDLDTLFLAMSKK
ncbi:non-ribosomal peptide synthetase [Bacillus cereus]|uniref:non-ribosomal peptide synthetase n=1 Tax=Bacillus cereus TaxID=1396 RepID=UPI000BFBEF82|nr:non-ribosomal peptide synthetase [Bacillus cereus]PGU74039.1 hypothetical protein COD76_30645 [Bacillus cereus]